MPSYYLGVPLPELAVPITVAKATEVSGINFGLGMNPNSVAVHFNLVESGKPAESGTVQIRPRTMLPDVSIVDTQRIAPGQYTISGIPPGAYYLYILGRRLELDVPREDVNLGSIEVVKARVAGSISNQNGQPISVTRVLFSPTPSDHGYPLSVPVSPAGTFEGSLVPGYYRIQTELQPGAYIESVTSNAIDVLGGMPVDGVGSHSVAVVVGQRAGSVKGNVIRRTGEAASNAVVALVPSDINLRSNPDLFYVQNTDQRGQFDFDSIRPGGYRIFAWQEVPDNAMRNPNWLREHETRGVSLEVRPQSSVSTVTLQLLPTSP
jgi:hypothetical protein